MTDASPISLKELPPGFSLRTFMGREEPALLRRSTELRHAVWVNEPMTMTGQYPDGRIEDKVDLDSWHCAIFEPGGEMVASARLYMYQQPEELHERPWFTGVAAQLVFPIAYWCRQVVLGAYRGLQLSAILEQELIQASRGFGAGCILIDIAPKRVARFQRHGYQILRPAEPGVMFPDEQWVHIIQYL